MNSTEENIDELFQKAYERACKTKEKFPQDIMLLFYAYYKQATEKAGIYTPGPESDLRSAFKLNALLQVKGLSVLEAKKRYIELADKYIGKE